MFGVESVDRGRVKHPWLPSPKIINQDRGGKTQMALVRGVSEAGGTIRIGRSCWDSDIVRVCTEEVTEFGCFGWNKERKGGFCSFQCGKGKKRNCVQFPE